MTRRREDVLQAALEAAARGEPMEPILAGLPAAESAEIRSLIAAAAAARSLQSGEVPPAASRRSRARLVRRGAAMASSLPARRRVWTLLPRFSAAALVALIALGLGIGGLNEAAANALPGEFLYPVKIAAADLRVRLEFEAGQRLRLETLYAERQLEDVRHLLALGRIVPVSFRGHVESIGPVLWQVEGIPVRLAPETRVVGYILPGMEIEVEGATQPDGTVLADELHLQSYDLLGTLQAIDRERLTVDGLTLFRTGDSYIEPGLASGQRVLVRAAIDDAGRHTIVSAVRFQPPTPTPTATATATPRPTSTPEPPTPTRAAPTEEHSGSGGETPESNDGDDDDDDESGGESQEPEKAEFEGVVQAVGSSQWVVDGRTLVVNSETDIEDDPEVGDTVRVVAFLQADGSWWAEKIELADD
jgi:hypothetical protein